MDDVGSASALVLAGILAIAGGSKLVRTPALASTLRSFGVPAPALVTRVLPWAELGLAVTLLAAPVVGGALTLVFLILSSVVVARALRAGVVAPCACFGGTTQEPASFVEIVRNGLLAALAAGSLFCTRLQAPSLGAVILVSTAAVAGLVVLALCRLRTRGPLFQQTADARGAAGP